VESPYNFKTPTGFEKYDIVVLCERNHAEFSQYELIYNIVSYELFMEFLGLHIAISVVELYYNIYKITKI
jgi:hypothetical protein